MTFLAPILLLGLPLAALPVIIHLIRLHRRHSYAGTNSMRTRRPRAFAARVRVVSVTDLHSGSSNRSTAALDVPIISAIWDFLTLRFFMRSASFMAVTRLSAVISTSARMSSSSRNSLRVLPRWGFFLAVLRVFIFSLQGQRLVLYRCFLSLLDESMNEDDFLIMDEKECPGYPRRQARTHFPESIPKAPHKRHTQWPTILQRHEIFSDSPAFVGRQSLEPFSHRLVARRGSEKDNGQGSVCGHDLKCIYFDTLGKLNSRHFALMS